MASHIRRVPQAADVFEVPADLGGAFEAEDEDADARGVAPLRRDPGRVERPAARGYSYVRAQ